jgi:hypothetical protein
MKVLPQFEIAAAIVSVPIIFLCVMIHVFVVLQRRIGNSAAPMVRFLTAHETGVTFALPFGLPELIGFEMPYGSRMGMEEVVFDYQRGEPGMRFPQARYYWLETKKSDPHIAVLNIRITPWKMTKEDLLTFQHRVQSQLLADGWMPGHRVADSEETIRMWSGRRTSGDSEGKRDEPPGSGEFILYIDLRPKNENRDLVFERSAWPETP